MIRILSWICIVAFILFFFCGCAILREGLTSYQACASDPNCVQQIEDLADSDNSPLGIVIGLISVLATGFGIKKYKDRQKLRR